jgi:hypothetical protein
VPPVTRESLMPLEAYAKARPEFRARVMAHKKDRQLLLGPNVTLVFEDELTVRYQIQEMLRVERIFEDEGIQEELGAYNPLIPDGTNWKATMMVEYPDEDERRVMLAKLGGIENRVWMGIAGTERVYAIADEDLERTTDGKTSAVHFLRFELGTGRVQALKRGASLSAGIDHPHYDVTVNAVDERTRGSLLGDLGP